MAKALWVSARNEPALSQGTTYYLACANTRLLEETTEANAQITQRVDGTHANLYVRITYNDVTSSSTATFRKNGSNGNLTVTIGASTTGVFEDTSSADNVTDGDEINYSVVVGSAAGGTLIVPSVMAVTLAAAINTTIRYACVGIPVFSSSVRYFPIGGSVISAGSTTEARSRFDVNSSSTYRNLFVYVSVNTGTPATDTVMFRLNGADTLLKLTIPATTTGIFENTSNTVSVVANDDVNYKYTPNTGTETLEIISVESTSGDSTFHLLNAQTNIGLLAFNRTRYVPVSGAGIIETNEADAQVLAKMNATLSNLTCYVHTNTIVE